MKLLQCSTIITPKKYVLPKTNQTILFTFNNEIFLMITRYKEENGRIHISQSYYNTLQ
jgi:hypothetical protein